MRTLQGARTGGRGLPVLKARSIEDLLASVPTLFGFHPRRSLVAIAMHGKRLGFRLRVDLPSPPDVDAVAEQILIPLLDQRPDGVIVIAYVEPEPTPEVRGAERLAADHLVNAILARLDAGGIGTREAVRCDGNRYWSYLCESDGCCSPEGTPYEVESSPVLARAVYNGVEVLPDRESLERRFLPVRGADRIRMAAVTDAVVDEVLGEVELGAASPADRGRLLRRGADFMTERLGQLDSAAARIRDDEDAARLSVWSMLTPVRDLAWSYIQPRNAPDHLTLWTAVAQRVVPPFEPSVLSLAGFAAWLSGDGAQARCALERTLHVDRDYTMARLLAQVLDGYLPPSAWRPFDRTGLHAMFADGT